MMLTCFCREDKRVRVQTRKELALLLGQAQHHGLDSIQLRIDAGLHATGIREHVKEKLVYEQSSNGMNEQVHYIYA